MPCARLNWLGGVCLLAGLGCTAHGPYQYSRFHPAEPDTARAAPVVFEQGLPNKTLDGIAHVVGMPARLLRMNSKVNNHDLSAKTTEQLKSYLERNDLTDVSVFVNHYDPAGQWRRLRENSRVAAGWRYTLGTISMIGYTILPGRVFGGDSYNPYTNSLLLNSDVPALVLYEAAFAKDIHGRKLPGCYAAANELPGLSFWRRSRAASDVVGYAREQKDWETERQAYHVLYPHIGAQSFSFLGPITTLWWEGPAFMLGGATMGHVAGRTLAARREGEIRAADSPDALLTVFTPDGPRPVPTAPTLASPPGAIQLTGAILPQPPGAAE
jgi:hypothetical protein